MKRACLVSIAVVVVGAEAMMPLTPPSVVLSDGQDTLVQDTAMYDTLREVMVMGDSLKLAPVRGIIDERVKRNEPQVKSLGEVLNKLAPNTMDYVLHPFGFAERKKKKKVKRMNQILQEYDRVDAAQNDFNHKLDSILKLEGLK